MAYPFNKIEPKWQKYWRENETFKTSGDRSKPKFYVLDMFPYPSGQGLHIGHPEGYTATDIIGRYKMSKGFNVLHPMGFDAFGLPTERYCMKTGIHPIEATKHNIANFRRQLDELGLGYDWSKQVNTTDPEYYKWTQWMFKLIYNSWYDKEQDKARHIDELPIPEDLNSEKEIEDHKDKHRLAYIAMIPVNWCEELGTVLANEEVDEWKEKGYTVERKPMRQWMLKITEYAQRLLDDLDLVDWPHSTMEMQKHWIGKSEGAEVEFKLAGIDESVRVFTTRPDTLFGASYMVIAPEHDLVKKITTEEKKDEVKAYIENAMSKTDLERTELSKDKSGVFTGGFAVNPVNGEKIPVWIADYVLVHYGTGAIMAVPGHDERDHEFATKFGLPIQKVVEPADGSDWNIKKEAFTEYGTNVNSENAEISINGLATEQAQEKITTWLNGKNIGEKKTQYKLRDWLFSRQRYWGEPIPVMFFEDGTKRVLDDDELPLTLPDVENFKPAGTGESPLATVDEWVNFTDKKTGMKAKLETNTMPQWAGSCWYYLRYIDPGNSEIFCDKDKESYWMAPNGVDLYVGGAEHAVLHLLYARFWHKVLYDHGYVSTKEPFNKLFHQGLILGEDGNKMSKSRGNVINPDDVIKEYGADSLRLFEMFLGPLEAAKPWSTQDISGVFNFLNKAWRMIVAENGSLHPQIQDTKLNKEHEYVLHSTIQKVGKDIENLRFNTAISQLMIFVNEFSKSKVKPKGAIEKFVICLAPFAPHIGEELWRILGNEGSVSHAEFPEFDPEKAKKQEIEFVVQVKSKIRAKLKVEPDTPQETIETLAKENEKVQKHLEGKEIKKVIFVPNKLINFIAI